MRIALGCIFASLLAAGAARGIEYHVSQAQAAADENPGTADKPWRTLAKAGETAKAGDVVKIHAGTYRDCLRIRNSGTPQAPITFAAAGDGAVLVSGADPVDGFTQEGPDWVKKPWAHHFAWPWGAESTYVDYANANSPFQSAARMENVFVNGLPLQWVPRAADLAPGRFFWDGRPDGGGELRIRPPEGLTSPAHVTIEVPLREYVLCGPWGGYPRGMAEVRSQKKESDPAYVPCTDIILRGLTFGYTREGFVTAGAVASGDRWTIENCTFQYMNAGGLWLGGDTPVVRHCRFLYNGKTGACSKFRLPGALIEDCVSIHNNRKFYKIDWDAGGIKLHTATDCTVRRLVTAFNFGAALWFDDSCERNTIEDCVSLGNRGLGLFYEISDAGVFRRNVSFGNGIGIQYAHSADGVLADNVIMGCSVAWMLGGDRGRFKGVNTTIQSNVVLRCSSRNMDWKWSKNPDGRDLASKNLIADNTFVTEGGATTFGLYSQEPSLASFEAAYKNAHGNRTLERLDAADSATRARLDWACSRTLESLSLIEPRLRLSAAGAHLEAVWPLGGRQGITGYWVKTADGPVLLLTVTQADAFSLLAPDAPNATLWDFSHLGLQAPQHLSAAGHVLTFHPEGSFAVITGLPQATRPLGELVTLSASQQGETRTTLRQGEAFQVDIALANPLTTPLRLTISGPGLPPTTETLAPGATRTLTVPQQAQPGTNGLAYRIESDVLGSPLEQSLPLRVTRVAVATRGAASPDAAPALVIDAPAQRNARIWDEDRGQSWEGASDLSARGNLTWGDQGLTAEIHVTDNRVVGPRPGAEACDGLECFFDGRTPKTFRAPTYGPGVVHLRLAAPATPAWQDLHLAAKPLISNGDFHAGLTDWYLPQGSTAQVVNEDGNAFTRIQGASIIQRDVALNPAWGRLRVTCRARHANIVPGTLAWHEGRVSVDFKDQAGKHAGGWPAMLSFRGSCPAWTNETAEYDIPANATKFRLQVGMWMVKSGTLDIDDISVTPITDRAGNPVVTGQVDGVTASGRQTSDGYEARVTVAWSCFPGFVPRPGSTLGFDLALDDVDVPEARNLKSQLVWQGSDGFDAQDPSQFGFVTLGP